MLILPATADTIDSFIAEAEAAPDELSGIANVMPAPPLPFLLGEQHGRLVIFALLVYGARSRPANAQFAPFRALAEPIVDMLGPKRYPEIFAASELVL
jgi:hypothetical protein